MFRRYIPPAVSLSETESMSSTSSTMSTTTTMSMSAHQKHSRRSCVNSRVHDKCELYRMKIRKYTRKLHEQKKRKYARKHARKQEPPSSTHTKNDSVLPTPHLPSYGEAVTQLQRQGAQTNPSQSHQQQSRNEGGPFVFGTPSHQQQSRNEGVPVVSHLPSFGDHDPINPSQSNQQQSRDDGVPFGTPYDKL